MIAAAVAGFIKSAYVLGAAMGATSLLTWAERKQSAMMQDRIGANRASVLGVRALGLFHIITDAVKTIAKEDYIPPFADKMLFWLAPLVAGVAAGIGFVVVPFGPTISVLGMDVPLVIARSEIGMLVLLGALGLSIYGSFLGGAASGNKWAYLGAMRAGAQMAAYEVALGLSLVGVFMVHGTLDLVRIADAQQGSLLNWGVFAQPLGFLLFFTAAAAETKRAPFDVPEGESEIIGYFVEYSGMKFGVFFMAELLETILFSAVIAVLFFGGWHLPGIEYAALPWWLALVVSQAVWWGKVATGCWLFLLIRWTLPRFRYDQLLDLGWKWLLPLALANILLTGALIVWRGGGS